MNTTVEREVEVTGELGLHARPAAEFATAAARYTSDVRVAKGDREVDAKSVLLVLTLDVRHADHVTLRARGADADRAVEELGRLVGA
ncbi:MAG TPA: HPr family phosphocarrier protein, partial [Actinomycetota bacterium]|nr:HPr family phosphocarrier protein [Actinomycetota bacterium]